MGGSDIDVVKAVFAAFTERDVEGVLAHADPDIVFNAGATVTGAIAARDIDFRQNGGNAGFTGDPEANNATGRWDGSYTRNGWRECPPTAGC